MKGKFFIVIFLFMCMACAPHTHYYRSLQKESKNELKIFNYQFDYIWLFDQHKTDLDTVFIQSNHFKDMQTPKVMDTLNYRQKKSQQTFFIRMKARKFKKLVRVDTITIKYKADQRWIEEKFIIIPDNYLKKRLLR